MTAPYNSLDGIPIYLTSLEGLNRLAEDRRAARARKEPLYDFYVMGRWSFDELGQTHTLGDGERYKAPAELGTCPPVMTVEQMRLFMRDDTLCKTSKWSFPPAYAKCTVCNERWHLDNAHDLMTRQESEEAVIEGFVGKPLAEITEIPELVSLKWHHVGHDMIYNDHHPEGADVHEARDGTKWRRVDKDYVVQPGDRASVQVMHFTHRGCYQLREERRTRTEIEEAFTKAGFPKVSLITRKNEYCGCENCTPWYTAQVGGCQPFVVGWRKSVINVSWRETGVSLPDLFEGEAVSRDSQYIHAHGYEKLAQYLTKLLPALGARQ